MSAIVPTRNRYASMKRMLESLAQQSAQPEEMIVVDASATDETAELCREKISGLLTRIEYRRASEAGAAAQRNQAMAFAGQTAILFIDDDIIFEADCIRHLWAAIESDPKLGGVNAMITNQRYFPPGGVSRTVFRLLNGQKLESYAGKCIGPAFNLLPEDRDDLPDVVEVEWLNTTCTLYRRRALPQPPFPKQFTGYSMMEDLTLSLLVGRNWKLANARRARIFHDSQPGAHKDNTAAVARMELVNRHYVMTRILERRRLADYLRLVLFQTFGITTSLTTKSAWSSLPAVLRGKAAGIKEILLARESANGEER